MTAIRVIDDHDELEHAGQVSHEDLDTYIGQTSWLVLSGTSGPVPLSARRLIAGSGITFVDGGPGGDLVINAMPVSGSGNLISWNEVPSGSNDGLNMVFSFAFDAVPPSAMLLFINGVKQRQGFSSDYILSGSVAVLISGYRSGSNIDATYPY